MSNLGRIVTKKEIRSIVNKYKDIPRNVSLSPQSEAFYKIVNFVDKELQITKASGSLATFYGYASNLGGGFNQQVFNGNSVHIRPFANYLELYQLHEKVDIISRCVKARVGAVLKKLDDVKVIPKDNSKNANVVGQDVDYLMSLFNQPNKHSSREEWISDILTGKLIAGNSYNEKIFKRSGVVSQIYHDILPWEMSIIADAEEYKKGHEIVAGYYRQKNTLMSKGYFVYDVDDIIHFKNPSETNNFYGASPIEKIYRAAMILLMMDNFNLAFFHNGMVNSKQITMPEGVSEEDAIAVYQYIENKYIGSINAHKPVLMVGGAKIEDIGGSPTEIGFLESRKKYEIAVSNEFSVPLSLVNLGEHTGIVNNDTAEETTWFDENVSDPDLRSILNVLNTQVVAKTGITDLKYSYQNTAVKGFSKLHDVYVQNVQRGSMSWNEYRRLLKLGEPIESKWADDYLFYKTDGIIPMEIMYKQAYEQQNKQEETKPFMSIPSKIEMPNDNKEQQQTQGESEEVSDKEETIEGDVEEEGKPQESLAEKKSLIGMTNHHLEKLNQYYSL